MRKLSYDPQIKHFSHHHTLDLFNVQHQQAASSLASCSGCKLQPSGWIYNCRSCNYILHVSCSQKPQLINHPSHSKHPLTLFPCPVYPEGLFNCDACGNQGDGFCYHCSDCNLDFHLLCASMPLLVNHHAHPHQLELTFYPPYETKGFSCDICRRLGSKHWLYHCASCEFDAHLDCVVGRTRPMTQSQIQKPQLLLQHHHSFPGATHPHIPRPAGPQQLNYYMHSPSVGVPQSFQASGTTGSRNPLMNAAIQGFVEGAAQQVGQSFMQSIMGGSNPSANNSGNSGESSSTSILDVGSSFLNGMFGDSG